MFPSVLLSCYFTFILSLFYFLYNFSFLILVLFCCLVYFWLLHFHALVCWITLFFFVLSLLSSPPLHFTFTSLLVYKFGAFYDYRSPFRLHSKRWFALCSFSSTSVVLLRITGSHLLYTFPIGSLLAPVLAFSYLYHWLFLLPWLTLLSWSWMHWVPLKYWCWFTECAITFWKTVKGKGILVMGRGDP
jgi:hypothetical protein